MKVLDSLNDKRWNGKGLVISKDSFVLKANSRASHDIDIKSGKHVLHILGKKRSGNGKVAAHVISKEGILLLSEEFEFSNSSLTEVRFEFEAPLDYGLGELLLKRDSGAFGTIEISRLKLTRDQEQEKEKRLEEAKRKRRREDIPLPPSGFDSSFDTKRKIAFIVPYAIYGGAEVYIQSIMENIDPSIYQIDFLFLGKNKLMSLLKDPRYGMRLCRSMESLKGSLVSNHYDYIVYYNRADVYRLLSSLRSSGEIVSKLVEIYHSDFEWPGALSKIRVRKNVDTLFRVAPSLAQDISGVPSDRKVTLPVGVNLKRFSFAHRDEMMRKVLLKGRKGVIGTVARISPEKNIDYILKLATKMTDYSFVIVGDGPMLKAVRMFVSDRKIDNVTFLGFQTDVHKYYPNFDAFLLPSKMEGTPISIIEAMASGTLVFSSKVGAIPDIVKHNDTGFFITGTPAKDRKLIIENLDRLDVIGNARRMVEREHDIKENSQEFMRAMIDTDQHFVEAEEGDHVVILRGKFI